MIKNYIKIAFRNLWRSKTFSFINIAGLSVGLACCMLIVLYTKDEVSYDRFHTNSSNIFRIVADEYDPNTKINNQLSVTGMLAGPAFKKSIPEIKEFVRLQHTSFTVKNEGDVFDQPATFVDPSFFSVFSFPLISGDPSKALNEINSVVLSEDIAEKYFGKSNAIGQTLELKVDGKFSHLKFLL
jgi:putative ABC transport system permease protein